MGIVESPLLFYEIVPDAASEKRLARAGIAARARSVNKRRAAFAERVVIAMTVAQILVGDAGGPFVANAIRFERRYHTVFDCRSTLPHADGTLSKSLRERSISRRTLATTVPRPPRS